MSDPHRYEIRSGTAARSFSHDVRRQRMEDWADQIVANSWGRIYAFEDTAQEHCSGAFATQGARDRLLVMEEQRYAAAEAAALEARDRLAAATRELNEILQRVENIQDGVDIGTAAAGLLSLPLTGPAALIATVGIGTVSLVNNLSREGPALSGTTVAQTGLDGAAAGIQGAELAGVRVPGIVGAVPPVATVASSAVGLYSAASTSATQFGSSDLAALRGQLAAHDATWLQNLNGYGMARHRVMTAISAAERADENLRQAYRRRTEERKRHFQRMVKRIDTCIVRLAPMLEERSGR
ncbi:MAG: hypothetical protein KF729_09920 [Sandaracinaceae bacterium]|nr:hypothetical protein [Sandaracinaceae bacterium]